MLEGREEPTVRATNVEVADLLDRVADLLDAQDADVFRVRAYRRAAATVRTLDHSLFDLFEQEELKGLEALPAIGKSIAVSIAEFLQTGRLGLLDRLEGEVTAEDLFTTLPGIGEELAKRIHDELQVETLEDLEIAAHDGRLSRVFGIGRRRVQAIRSELAETLRSSGRRRARRVRMRETAEINERPSVAAILSVDEEYRRRAGSGSLRKIAPRRFNPTGEAWLPILHTTREGWFFKALFSNSARAHNLGAVRDWVIVIHERDGAKGQCTVVTEHAGPLRGERVVRGRETECAATRSA
jgi:DNA polymerase/3'-5' exonuclease PolX